MSTYGGYQPAPRGPYVPTPTGSRLPVQRPVETPGGAAKFMGIALVVLWVLEILDALTLHALDNFAIHARSLEGLPFIFTAPVLHFGFDHLVSNSVPFFVFGWLVMISGRNRWIVATLFSVVASGLFAWLLTPAGALIAGASGVIFGWFAYLLVRGVFTRDWRQIGIAVILLAAYGGMIWGVLPTQAGVSWQAHLGGAVGGTAAAWVMHKRN